MNILKYLKELIFSIGGIILFIGSIIGALNIFFGFSTEFIPNYFFYFFILFYSLGNYQLVKKRNNELEKQTQLIKKLQCNNIPNLNELWNLREINCQSPILPDVIKIINSMSETANYWNNEIVNKKVMIDSCFSIFEKLYFQLKNCTTEIKTNDGIKKCSWYINDKPEISKLYNEMKLYKDSI
uniref:hypothetical protein n=1 Tax=Aliarcobacter sp. TaxID=2321116 RepID=UPI004048B78F